MNCVIYVVPKRRATNKQLKSIVSLLSLNNVGWGSYPPPGIISEVAYKPKMYLEPRSVSIINEIEVADFTFWSEVQAKWDLKQVPSVTIRKLFPTDHLNTSLPSLP